MESDSRRDVRLRVNDAPLEGRLTVPDGATGLVVLVNGGWGVRYASRESKLAVALQRRGFGTLGVDLLTLSEDTDRTSRYATDPQAGRLAGVAAWLDARDRTASLPRGILGVGPGAAAALRTVARFGTSVEAVVCLDGRFGDVASGLLDDRFVAGVADVGVPTLFVVERTDDRLLEANRRVCDRLGGEDRRGVVLHPETSRSGADRVGPAADWFETHLGARP